MEKIMKINLSSVKNIAFVMSPRLGDSLLAMVVVHNLQRNNYAVTVFSNHLYALRQWFPADTIKPYPDEASAKEVLKPFDLLLHSYPHDVLFQANQWHPFVVAFDNYPLYHRCESMLDLQIAVCKEMLNLSDVVRSNGLAAPPGLQFRNNHKRVVIHPTAHMKVRYWLPNRFIQLANQLKTQAYNPVFVVAPPEQKDVPWIKENNLTEMVPANLDELARWIYESGWFIGNDSGVGHLASNLGVPTLTLMQRRKLKIRWRPSWAPGIALLPAIPLLLKNWKERYWKYFISVSRVMKSFKQLTQRYPTLME